MEMKVNFKKIDSPYSIKKSLFFSPSFNNNLRYITYDTQGQRWSNDERLKTIIHYIETNPGYHNITPVSQQEILERNEFNELMSTEEYYYQFSKFYKDLPVHTLHFQLRKNLKKIKNELYYTKEYGIESFDLVTKKRQNLVSFEENVAAKVLCYDIKQNQNNNNYLIFVGRTDSLSEVYEINYEDYIKEKIKKNANNTPINKKILEITELSNGENDLINHVKFLNGDRVLTTSNHFELFIYDLNYIEKPIYQIKEKYAINHCDLNENKNILICVGDTTKTYIYDFKSKSVIKELGEHFDYGIVCRINKFDENYFATGNQDFGCKIWDLRNLNHSVYTLYGQCNTISEIQWINSQRISYGESTFFINIFDANFNKRIQQLKTCAFLNGMVYDEENKIIYISANNGDNGGIFCYEEISAYNDFNYINI